MRSTRGLVIAAVARPEEWLGIVMSLSGDHRRAQKPPRPASVRISAQAPNSTNSGFHPHSLGVADHQATLAPRSHEMVPKRRNGWRTRQVPRPGSAPRARSETIALRGSELLRPSASLPRSVACPKAARAAQLGLIAMQFEHVYLSIKPGGWRNAC